ncbi:hypothetical protein Fmac_031827 [Flemingia macrophylla]|uniref:Uncharacterized protein n=1 Tax=Flemingia macrophylla TaxID=520843 RepID=A0ABD1L360_9FABA
MGASPYQSSKNSTSFRAKSQKNIDIVEPPSPLQVGCCRGFSNSKSATAGSVPTSQQQNMHHLQFQKLQVKSIDVRYLERTEE